MRLVNHSITRSEVKISEGLGRGLRHVVSEPQRGLLLSISMAGGESKVVRLQETPAKEIEEAQAPESEFWPGRGMDTGTLRRVGTGAQSTG